MNNWKMNWNHFSIELPLNLLYNKKLIKKHPKSIKILTIYLGLKDLMGMLLQPTSRWTNTMRFIKNYKRRDKPKEHQKNISIVVLRTKITNNYNNN